MRRWILSAALMTLALLGGMAVRAQKMARPHPHSFRLEKTPALALALAPPVAPDQPPPADAATTPPTLPALAADPMPAGDPTLLPPPPAPAVAPAVDQPPDDPMQVVEAFVAENRKKAEGSIVALTKEAETLRGRLKRVEEALVRWKAVSAALEAPGEAHPTELGPADPPAPPDLEKPPAKSPRVK